VENQNRRYLAKKDLEKRLVGGENLLDCLGVGERLGERRG
jgi:hypothetical protein